MKREIADRIRGLWESSGLTQREYAKKLDINVSTLTAYINGRLYPSLEFLARLARYENVTTDWIIGNKTPTLQIGEGMVAIPESEYNGLKKALRIINDRALQQVDKSKTDKFGFKLLRADKTYNRELEGQLWLVTKETPYSAKIPLEEAKTLIELELREIYTFTDTIDLQKYCDKPLDRYSNNKIDGKDLPKIIKYWADRRDSDEWDTLTDNSDEGRALYKCWQEHSKMIYEISKISVNYAQGLYEVSYWATDAI